MDRCSTKQRFVNWISLHKTGLCIALALFILSGCLLGFYLYRSYQSELGKGSVCYPNVLFDPSYAAVLEEWAKTNPPEPAVTPGLVPDGTAVSWTAGSDHSAPKAGDIVMNSRGEIVTLIETSTRSGVYLGIGQGVDLYGGMLDSKGTEIKNGYKGPSSLLYGASKRDCYVVDKRTGEGRFTSEWKKIREDQQFKPMGMEFHPDEGLYNGEIYLYRQWNSKDATWYWAGPLFWSPFSF